MMMMSKKKENPVKKNMDKLHRPVTHLDKKKENKRKPKEDYKND